MKIRLLLAGASVAILLGAVMVGRVNGANSTPREFTRDVIELNDHLANGTVVKVRIQKGKIPANYPYKSPSLVMWGAPRDGEVPAEAITAINVKIGNREIFVPLSAYSDLGSPRWVSLEKTKRGFQVIITGAGSGGGYGAALVFEGNNIKRRKVANGAFRDEWSEETVYSFPDDAGRR